ncbi:MAG: hypothetical protein ACREA9_08940 [Pyrinomonadaceae bacterium]
MRHTTRFIRIAMFLLLVPLAVYAHGTSVKTDKQSAAPGETITVKGEGITTNGEIKLSLRGTQDYPLGTARGDEHGRFEQQVALPADIHPGDYSLMAEGEKTASVRLKIVAAADQGGHMSQMKLPPASQEHEQAIPGMENVSDAKASPMEVQRPRGTTEAILRWGIVVASLVLGLGLRGRRTRKNAV